MDKFQSAFEILYILSKADGESTTEEMEAIVEFLNDNSEAIQFTPSKVAESIDTLTNEGMLEELSRAANIIKQSSGAEDRKTLLDFAIRLIAADGNFSQEEMALFSALADLWNIDVRKYMSSMT